MAIPNYHDFVLGKQKLVKELAEVDDDFEDLVE